MMHEQRATTATRYPARMSLRAPNGLPAAIQAAARARHTAPAEWCRQALLRSLERDGLTLTPDGRVEEVQLTEGRRES